MRDENFARGEAGFSLTAVVIALVLLGAMSLGSMALVGGELKAARGFPEASRAFYAAEAGLNLLIANWGTEKYDTLVPNPGDTATLDWMTLPGNEGSYAALLQRIDDGTDTLYSMTVRGRSAAAAWSRRTVRVTLEGLAPDTSVYRWAAFGLNHVETNNGWTYGNVASNDFVELKGGSVIDGDATAVDIVKNPAGVTGTVTEGAAPETFDPVNCPAIPYGPAPLGATVDFNAGNGELKTSGGDVSFPAGTYYFTKFEGAGHFHVAVGDSVTIFIDGPLSISGTGIDNPLPNGSGDLTILGCGTDNSQWDFDFPAGSDNRVVVYALDHDVNLKKGGFFGSFIALNIKKATSDDLTYDTNLSGGGGGGGGGGSGTPVIVVSGSRTSLSQ